MNFADVRSREFCAFRSYLLLHFVGHALFHADLLSFLDCTLIEHPLQKFLFSSCANFMQIKFLNRTLALQAIADRPKDYLQQLLAYYQNYGGIFKVCLGPKAFLIVSDPAVVRHIMAENAMKYDKGILAEILEPIMGKVGV